MTTNRVIALIAASLCSQWIVAADAPPKESTKGFEISIVVTDRGNAIFDAWDNPSGKRFDISAIKLAPRGKFLSALLMFKGCAPDKSGNCNADVDIIAYDPKGNVYGKMLGVELCQQKPAPNAGFTQLSRSRDAPKKEKWRSETTWANWILGITGMVAFLAGGMGCGAWPLS